MGKRGKTKSLRGEFGGVVPIPHPIGGVGLDNPIPEARGKTIITRK